MNIWEEWKEKKEAEAPIFVMHRLSGGVLQEACRGCRFLSTVRHKYDRGIFWTTQHCGRYPKGRINWNSNYLACRFKLPDS